MEIFPYTLYRIAGISIDKLQQPIGMDAALLEKGLQLYLQKKQSKALLNVEMGHFSRQLSDYQFKQSLLNLRRDIYNGRQFDPQLPGSDSLTEAQLSEVAGLQKKLHHYHALLLEIEGFEKSFAKIFEQASVEDSQQIQALAGEAALQKGLVLSSQTLLSRLMKFRQTEVSAFRKKEWQTERGLLQYLSRTAVKCSPFSSFTNLGVWPSQESGTLQSFVWPNNHILAHWQELLAQYPPFYRQLPIALNPSVLKKKTKYILLLNSRNVESLQELEKNEALDFIHEKLLFQLPALQFYELLQIAIQEMDADEESVEQYLLELVAIGFLEWQWPVSGTDANWAREFQKMLSQIQLDTKLSQLFDVAKTLEKNAALYASATISGRLELLKTCHQKLSAVTALFFEDRADDDEQSVSEAQVFHRFAAQDFQIRREHIFYEDTVRQLPEAKKLASLPTILRDIRQMLELIAPLQQPSFNAQLTTFFKAHFPLSSEVTVLEFYEKYYQDKEMHGTVLPTELENLRSAWVSRLTKNKSIIDGVVDLELSQLQTAFDELDLKKVEKALPENYGALLQNFTDANGQLAVYLDACFHGYGKMWSRFLELFPKEITDVQHGWNNTVDEDNMRVENTDGSYFNANLHPPLLQYEIAMPGSQNRLPAAQQIAISQLLISLDSKTDELILTNSRGGKKVTVFDLGFEAISGRSPMYQLLSAFGPAVVRHQLIGELLAPHFKQVDAQGVIFYPRIQLGQCLVLQRRSWYIPKSILPIQEPEESEAAYFLRLQIWRMEIGFPSKVFIKLHPEKVDISAVPQNILNALKADDRKPQYMDFERPAMIRLWRYLIQRVPLYLQMEEMLPKPDGLYSVDNERFVMEWVVEWR